MPETRAGGGADSQGTLSGEGPKVDTDTIEKVGQGDVLHEFPDDKDLHVVMDAEYNNGTLSVSITNESSDTLTIGNEYAICRRCDGEWVELNLLSGVGFNDIAYEIEKGKSHVFELNPVNEYGNLESGEYKVTKEIRLDNYKAEVSAEFKVD